MRLHLKLENDLTGLIYDIEKNVNDKLKLIKSFEQLKNRYKINQILPCCQLFLFI